MVISEKGKDLIKSFENISLNAYRDSGGVYTIGYGNTFYENGKRVKIGDVITKQRAEALFDYHVTYFSKNVAKIFENTKTTLNSNQFDAIVSITYNIGLNKFKESCICKNILNKSKTEEVTKCIMKYVYDNGVISKGLVNRRKKEAQLYSSI